MSSINIIPVTKTFFPPIEEYINNVQRIFDNGWLTNRGELTLELESKLKEYLQVPNMLITNNGTVPIQIALNLFAKEGEVITTPYSYIATTSAILWEKCKPVFVDIHPEYLTIDENKIEAAITEKTTCILATHVYGNPCNVKEIEKIAKKHNLVVIYDAAHCFGVEYDSKSIFNYGDVSTCSFHATKIFHTAEGGALFCQSKETLHELYYRHNFGHKDEISFHGIGINAKISELHSAMGLTVLNYMPDIIGERKRIVNLYDAKLKFNTFRRIKIRENTKWNYSYYPIIFDSHEEMIKKQDELKEINVFPRRYFTPSLNQLDFVEKCDMPISQKTAAAVLCLPLYNKLEESSQLSIIETLNS